MTEPTIRIDRDGPLAVVTLDRPSVRNAFDDVLIAELCEALHKLAREEALRVLVLTGAGKVFSAGADLNWMRRMAEYSQEENLEDARRLEELIHCLDEFPKPTVAAVNGPAIAGAMGLVAACDVVVAVEEASFGLSEVRIGLLPAIVAPYVRRAIGERACRRYFLTGERFGAHEARRLGLVHEVVPPGDLWVRVDALVRELAAGGPAAQGEAKSLLRLIPQLGGSLLGEATARAIATRRASEEGKEGVRAFLEKRRPAWATEPPASRSRPADANTGAVAGGGSTVGSSDTSVSKPGASGPSASGTSASGPISSEPGAPNRDGPANSGSATGLSGAPASPASPGTGDTKEP